MQVNMPNEWRTLGTPADAHGGGELSMSHSLPRASQPPPTITTSRVMRGATSALPQVGGTLPPSRRNQLAGAWTGGTNRLWRRLRRGLVLARRTGDRCSEIRSRILYDDLPGWQDTRDTRWPLQRCPVPELRPMAT